MIVRIFLSIVGIVSLLSVMPSYVSSADFIQGIAKLSSQLTDGSSVQVEVRTMKLTPQYPYKNAFMWGGDMRGRDEVLMPKTVITAMDVRINNEKIFLPLSAYSDLGNPYQVSLEKAERGFRLVITGRGGTATSYKAVLEFNHENIQRRKVTLDVFPDEVWEETVYSFISNKQELNNKNKEHIK